MSDRDEKDKTPPRRITTGVPGLDTVLSGGLLPGAVYIVQGSPGAGKTILANQICFHRVTQGEKALYVTLLAESHARLIQNLERMSFYDERRLPSSIFYVSGYDDLESGGLEGILRLLNHESQRRGTSLIVVDGLFVLEESVQSEREFRKFVNYLSTLASLLTATILLLTNSRRTQASPEYTMVDGWIEVATATHGHLGSRYVQVHKFRGSDFVAGLHTTVISDDGMRVLPRLEATTGLEGQGAAEVARVPSGVPALDGLIGGGVPQGSTTLVLGPTGVGKTTLGLHFIAQCSEQAPGLIFGFYENASRLALKARMLGIDLEGLVRRGAVEVVWQPASEPSLDGLGYRLIEAVRRRGAKRVLVDGLRGFERAQFYDERSSPFLAALTHVLRAEGVTSLYTSEVPQIIGERSEISFGPISAVAENILLMRYVELDSALHRLLSVLKVRDSDFDSAVRRFVIDARGIRIGDVFRDTEGLLTGHAHRPPADA
ncbi:ATPase domain-containing protein [Solimonas soli]|uniref:ATPase domain-containing protein n=1 Tax=Solimonas soli TaxID=413479 RepID=UPI0004BC9F0B|nr:ATPase domain-containing protein [Solimonas soli]